MSGMSEKLLMAYARRFPIRRGKLRIVDTLWQRAISGRDTRRLATLKHGEFKMTCDLSEMLQRQFYFFGTYFLEEEILSCWAAAAKCAKVIFDIGANAGIYSLAALGVRPDAVVHAFEPTPEIAVRLRATARLNALDHLQVHQAAVSSNNGSATLKRFRGDFDTNEGMNFISEDDANSQGEKVETLSLDCFSRDHSIGSVDLLKIDVQGHEHLVLKGAEQLIGAGRIETIFMELNWGGSAGKTCPAAESVRLLAQANYLFSKPGRHLRWQRAGEWLRNLNDVVAHRAAHGEVVRYQ
jgi:FkbM family methyltransferase